MRCLGSFGTRLFQISTLGVLCLAGAASAHATSYYISSAGNDANSGTAPSQAWLTFANVNAKQFQPGDQILLKAGDTFTGTMTMNSSGSVTQPIVISSYGKGVATIDGGANDGIDITNASHVRVTGLTLYGTGGTYAYNFGVSYTATSGEQADIAVNNITVYGFGIGISFLTNTGGTFSGVTANGDTVYSNNYWGLYAQGYNNSSSPYSNISNLVINDGTFHDNGFSSKAYGSGVNLGGVNGAQVTHSVAYHNGDIGFWCYSSNNVVFSEDVSYSNQASNGDGGFDLDEGTTNSTIEYSYAHDNGGEGFEMAANSTSGQTDADLTIRYNISENDHYPIAFGNAPAGGFNGVYVYNNTIYTNRTDGLGYWAALNLFGGTAPNDMVFANNLVWNANSSEYDLQWATGTLAMNYDSFYGPAFEASYDGTDYTSFPTFQSSTGLETNGQFGVNPQLQGTPGTQDPNAYRLSQSSSLHTAGIDLKSAYGIDPGHRDYYGNSTSKSPMSIGASQ